MDDAADADATQLAPPQASHPTGATQDDDLWAVRSPGDDKQGDGVGARRVPVHYGPPSIPRRRTRAGGDVACFVAAARGNPAAKGAVLAAVELAATRDGPAPATCEGAAATAAGTACLRALRKALDALGAAGSALVAREAQAFRASVGVPATAAARG
eukprot:6180835-Pleurochrysis_carterae.AAC.2